MATTPRSANYTIAVLRRVLGWAVDHGLMAVNPASRPRQLRTNARDEVWSPEAEVRFLDEATPPMRLAFLLAVYTAQRQGDILRMAWTQYDGASIRLRQSKTGRLVKVPCHPTLRAVLDATKRAAVTILATESGRAFKEDHFRHQWREVTKAAGLDGLQFRDLRRTAMVRLAEAGATDIEIAAVSGHEIETTRRILETYVPRTTAMAEAAIRKLERHGRNDSKTRGGKQAGQKVGNTPPSGKGKALET
ncbi:MAG: tyrosine-type recombinase/integrase [Alphaproteobacteria bacterium]|nr:tyrosine-type recombinase/integrase [Alphaproteobacteria bacterium]